MLSIEREWFCLNFMTLTEETWYPILLQLLHIFCKGQRLLQKVQYPGGSSRQIVEVKKTDERLTFTVTSLPGCLSFPGPSLPQWEDLGIGTMLTVTLGMKDRGCTHIVQSTIFSLVFIVN